MNKAELIAKIGETCKEKGVVLPATTMNAILDAFGETLCELVHDESKITIPGFGSFKMGEVKGKTGRNPRTGEPVEIRPKRSVKFDLTGPMKEALKK